MNKILGQVFILIVFLTCSNFSYAQTTTFERHNRTRTYDVQYQAQDSGRYQVNSAAQNEINVLNSQPSVLNLRIPILLGVKISNLEDTWGDARANGRTHEGIDILAPGGSFIVSPTDAVVTTVENSGNGGNHVFTANPGGERYYFAHLDSFAVGLTEGQILKAGELIGYVGNTGNASAGPTHLHFGIYQDSNFGAINPFPRLTLEFSLQDNLPPSMAQILSEKKVEALGISRTLKIGMSGDDVRWLQTALLISADGIFGPKTRLAVIAFQIKKGLTPDGIFGPKSRLALASSSLVEISLPVGCTANTIYSPTTGIKC